MKLIYCTECQDLFKLGKVAQHCECNQSGGMYHDDGLNAEYWGKAVPVGIANSSFLEAIKRRPMHGDGYEFSAFVIPIRCKTFVEGNGE